MLELITGDAPRTHQQDVDVGFVEPGGARRRMPLADAVAVRFELAEPVRTFPSYKRQRYFPGRWWSATTGAHVGYESWLERDQLMLLDFDPDVSGIASQPFWLFWQDGDKRRSHAPDYFCRRTDGTSAVIDCRPQDRIKPRAAAAFEATRTACQDIGWGYALVGAAELIRTANVRWLAGYRHPRYAAAAASAGDALLEVFAEPGPLMAGARRVGDPIAVLPALFHLMWAHQLVSDLSLRLNAGSTVAAGA